MSLTGCLCALQALKYSVANLCAAPAPEAGATQEKGGAKAEWQSSGASYVRTQPPPP